ncbi:MAG: glycoside hydrolase family 3 C-terminal domain-containing protein [Oscillospiraceae bacterium]|nr:glycoside hydrolase family 3 C-terminal domain-containing protein [Oscillospiraceae bacterium]
MSTTTYPKKFTRRDYRTDPPEARKKKIEALLRAMTREEKLSMLGGAKEPEDKGKIGNAGYQWGVPRLGVPEVVMYDGPAGITGIVETTGLPQPSLLGCTWDDEMAYMFGQVAATECASCSGNFLLAPQLDVIRSPHFVRNKDMKSEDSYQAARMGVQETLGVQANGAVATIKHFAAANLFGPDFLHYPKEVVDEQTLHETYCRSFDAAIHEGRAGSIMNAYNDVNGKYCSANRELLIDILREQWGFEGSVMSDWGSVHEFTLNKGMDMEMPYPAFNSAGRIDKNIARGRMGEERIDEALRHILNGMASIGLLGLVKLDEAGEVMEEPGRTSPIQMTWYYDADVEAGLLERNAEIAARIVREGTVLLKNENAALPLGENGKTVLLGLGAKYPICGQAQERSFGRLERMLSGKEAMEELTHRKFEVYPGIDYAGVTVPASVLFQDEAGEKPGLVRTYGIRDEDRDLVNVDRGPGGGGGAFLGAKLVDEDGDPVDTGLSSYNSAEEHVDAEKLGKFCCVDEKLEFTCGTDAAGKIVKNYRNGPNGTAFGEEESYTWKGFLKAPETGDYSLILQCVGGRASFFLKTEEGWTMPGQSQMREWAQWPWESTICSPEGMGITASTLRLEAGKAYPILVHARQCVRNKDLQLRLAWATPSFAKKNYEAALAAASEADTLVCFVCDKVVGSGLMGQRGQKISIELAEDQTKLLKDLLAAKKPGAKAVVIVQSSNARAIGDWAEQADAIVTAYMPGQEGARVLAEILTGKTNPSGKLNQSWPARPEDTPLTDTPEHDAERNLSVPFGDDTLVRFSEGIFTGYRWHDRSGVKPLFAFGHGLSYTGFAYSDLSIEAAAPSADFGPTWTVRCKVSNTGKSAGDEVVQLYLGKAEDVPYHIQMAEKQLVGYVRLRDLAPGETREAAMTIDPKMLCYWDPAMLLQTRSDGTKDKWVRAKGARKLYIGASSADLRLEGVIEA